MKARLHLFVSIATWLVGGLTALGQIDRLGLGAWGWLFDLCAQFPLHWAALALAVIGPALLLKQWRAALGAGAALMINIIVVLTAPPSAIPLTPPAGGADTLSVVSANLHGSGAALEKLAVQAQHADLIATYETFSKPEFDPERAKTLFAGARFAQRISRCPDGRRLNFQTLVVARRDIGPIDVACTPRGERAVVSFDTAGVRIVAVHTIAPENPADMAERDALLKLAASKIDPAKPFILMGDFNTTPWAHAYRQLPGMRLGHPLMDRTFPAGLSWLGLPIDHVLFGGGLWPGLYRVGDDIGSDHLPLFATLIIPKR